MTDELQNDDVSNDTVQETAESGAELATATGETQPKNEDGVTEATRKAINKQHAKFREQERRADAEKKRGDELEDRLAKFESEKGEVTIPPMPDSFDDDYDTQMSARDEAIRQQATQDAQKKNVIDQQAASNEAVEKANQERINGLVDGYDKRVVTLGLDMNEITSAGKTVIEYGIHPDIAEFILQHEDGPLITKYLANNPLELDDLRNMSSIQAALKIDSSIKVAASNLKPQASEAPDPTETLGGRGAGEQVSPLIKGATFE